MVSFALTDLDFDEGARLDAGLRVFSDLEELADFAGLSADLFLLVWAGLDDSRPAGFCAKAYCEKVGMKKTEETKRIVYRR